MIRFCLAILLLLTGLQGQTLTFKNGDVLSGNPLEVTAGKLQWEATNLKTNVELPLDVLQRVSYPETTMSQEGKPLMQIMMYRGDQYTGRVTAISDTHIMLSTAWAGEIKIDRRFINQMRPVNQNENLLADLPLLTGWSTVPNRTRWVANEDAISSNGRAAISKKIVTPESFRFACEMRFLSSPRLKFLFHASEGNVYEPSEYVEFSLQRSNVSARAKVEGNLEVLGQNVSVPELNPATLHQVELYCDFEEQRMVFYLNGKKVKQWVLPKGLKANPWMYIFSDYDGEVLLQEMVLEHWNGVLPYDPESISHIVTKDEKTLIFLENGDAIDAQKISYENQKILAKTDLGKVQVPLKRVGFIDFSGLPYQEAKRERNDIQLTLQNGDKITLNLESWGGGKLRGASQNFDAITVNEAALKEVVFDIYR